MARAPDLHEAYLLIRDVALAVRLFQQDNVHCAGVTFTQFTILDHIARAHGELPLADLHGLLQVEKSTTTRLLGPLVDKGLIARAQGRDARAVLLVLTTAGRSTHDAFWRCLAANIGRALEGIDVATFEQVARSLRLFIHAVARGAHGTCG